MLMRKINLDTGLFLEDAAVEIRPILPTGEPDPAYIALPCPDGLYKPCWDFAKERWFEAATQAEIDATVAAARSVQPPSQPERNAADIGYLAMMMGVEL